MKKSARVVVFISMAVASFECLEYWRSTIKCKEQTILLGPEFCLFLLLLALMGIGGVGLFIELCLTIQIFPGYFRDAHESFCASQ
jgi:hypothetical protein